MGGEPEFRNAFEEGKPRTEARDRVEATIEVLRQRGGVFVEAVRATRMPMALTDPSLPGNPIVFANQAFLDLSGYSMAEVLGQQPYFMNGPDTDPEDAERFRRILEDDQDGAVETVQYARDGRRFVATVLLSAFKDEAGRTLYHFLSWTDVTRRVDAEQDATELRKTQDTLGESEERYRELFEQIDQGFCIVEVIFEGDTAVDYRFLLVNPAFERHTGIIDAEGRLMRDIAPDHEQHWFDTYGKIARTGEPQRLEAPAKALGDRWYDLNAFRVGDPGQNHVAIVFSDVSQRRRDAEALRASEARQAFLLTLSDALRGQSDGNAMLEVAGRLLGERLQASRVMFADFRDNGGFVDIFFGWFADGAQPFPAVMRLADYEGPILDDLRAGRTVRIDDIGASSARSDLAAISELGVKALLSVGLILGGKLTMNLSVHQHEARRWTDEEVALVREVAERLWADVTRARAEAALRESEERLRQFGDASQDVLWIRDVETLQWQYLTPAFEAIYGVSREEALSGDNFRSWLDMILPEDRATAENAIRRVRDGEHVTFEYRVRRPADGSIRWLRNTDFPMRGRGREVTRIGGVGQDVTDLKAADIAVRDREARLKTIVDRARDYAILTLDADGRVNGWWAGAEAAFGYSAEEIVGRDSAVLWTPEDRADDAPAKERAAAQDQGRADDVRWHMRKDGTRVFIDGMVTPLFGPDMVVGYLKVGRDMTERHASDERQKVLVAELQHRTRNLMAVIRSMADKTARSSVDFADFRARYNDRLDAMARVQGLLSRLNEHDRVTFDELVRTELTGVHGSSDKVTLDGPAGVRLRSSTVQILAMALHELATNAVKYGALGQPEGRLAVLWSVERRPDGKPWLTIDWRETGVSMPPQGEKPTGSGQGRELIERAMPYQLQAETTYEHDADGVHCTISIAVSETSGALESVNA